MSADDKKHISRREWFSRMFSPVRAASKVAAPEPASGPDDSLVAVIAARSCLPYQGMPCTNCSDQCPVPGAIVFEHDLPVVVPEVCTGCRICRDVCPAPVNAILMIPRRPSQFPSSR